MSATTFEFDLSNTTLPCRTLSCTPVALVRASAVHGRRPSTARTTSRRPASLSLVHPRSRTFAPGADEPVRPLDRRTSAPYARGSFETPRPPGRSGRAPDGPVDSSRRGCRPDGALYTRVGRRDSGGYDQVPG